MHINRGTDFDLHLIAIVTGGYIMGKIKPLSVLFDDSYGLSKQLFNTQKSKWSLDFLCSQSSRGWCRCLLQKNEILRV